MKDFGICKECGQRIEEFEYAIAGLEFWYCRIHYYEKFPLRAPRWPDPETAFESSYIVDDGSYGFLKEHLYSAAVEACRLQPTMVGSNSLPLKLPHHDKPHLFEPDFRLVRPYSIFLRSFESLRHLLRFNTGLRCRRIPSLRRGASFRRKLKTELLNLGRARKDLKGAVIAVLLFVLWDDMLRQSGAGGFSDAYYELISQMGDSDLSSAE